MVEAFDDVAYPYIPNVRDPATNEAFDGLRRQFSEFISVLDTGAADTEIAIAHGLNRVPIGMSIVNGESGLSVGWYRDTDDTDWTKTHIYVRFDVANARVRLEVK